LRPRPLLFPYTTLFRSEIELARGDEAAMLLKAGSYDLVLADLDGLDLVAMSTDEAVARLARLADGALLIVLSDGGSVSAAVAARSEEHTSELQSRENLV